MVFLFETQYSIIVNLLLSKGFKMPIGTEMVFCYQNCYLLCEKIVLVIEKKILKFEAEGQEFAKILRSLEW